MSPAVTYGVRMEQGSGPARWKNERKWFRRGPGTPYRKWQTAKFLFTRDRTAVLRFLRAPYPPPIRLGDRLQLLAGDLRVTNEVRGYHTLAELLTVSDRILRLSGRPDLTVVEAGAGSGSSTVKLSLATALAGGQLHVFDTFQGIPENDEQHEYLDGTRLQFLKGAFKGRLGAVKRRVQTYGAAHVCSYYKGLLQDTLPDFTQPVDVVLLDLDLLSSTRAALTHLYPRLRPGGSLLSQDGHLRAIAELVADADFWRGLGEIPPELRTHLDGKLIELRRPPAGAGP